MDSEEVGRNGHPFNNLGIIIMTLLWSPLLWYFISLLFFKKRTSEKASALLSRDDQPKDHKEIPLTTLNDPFKGAEEVQRMFNLVDTPTHLYDKCKCDKQEKFDLLYQSKGLFLRQQICS